jgi:multisubunit Na+/H+ antiporter MnhE subunit
MAVREFGVAFVVLTIGYWLFVGKLSANEICLGLCGGALAALWTVALSRAATVRFRFQWRAIVTVAAAAATVPKAAAQVTAILVKSGRHRPRGSIIEQPFDHGRDRSPADATRRAAVLLGVSLAPDRFALLHDGDRMRVHRLVAGPRGGDGQWPA